MKRKIGMFVLWMGLLFSPVAMATDIPIFPTGAVYRLTNLAWGTSVQPGFNNNYFLTPLSLNESVCVYVKNNNPTNSHTFNATITINPDPNNITPSDGTWFSVAGGSNISVATASNPSAVIASAISGAAQVSINFSASTVQAGSPDTANVTIVQTQGSCFGGNSGSNQVNLSQQSTTSINPLQAFSDGIGQAYFATQTVTNPTAGQTMLTVNNSSSPRSIYFQRGIFSATATAQITITITSGPGTTCSTAASTGLKPGGFFTSIATIQQNCTTGPSGFQGFQIVIGSGATVSIDLSGIIGAQGTTNGLAISSVGAVTGTVTPTIFWYEK